MPNETTIIIDRKRKRYYYGFDEQFNDPTGIETAKKERMYELKIANDSTNPVDKQILQYGIKSLSGMYAYAMKHDSTMLEGWVFDVSPARVLLLKKDRRVIPVHFEHVVSIIRRT